MLQPVCVLSLSVWNYCSGANCAAIHPLVHLVEHCPSRSVSNTAAITVSQQMTNVHALIKIYLSSLRQIWMYILKHRRQTLLEKV